MPSVSLVIATYNWPKALACCLESVLRQSRFPDEVVIADDGSGSDTREVIEAFRNKTSIPVQHIWHEDHGFRLAHIRNRANVAAKHPYIIQVDGDLILHRHFVKDHAEAASPHCFIGGSRVLLDPELSASILEKGKADLHFYSTGIHNRFNALHSAFWGNLLSAIVKTNNAFNIRGCNMSYWKDDFVRVNGYNENYTGWGREDTDLVFRFYHNGLKRTFFKLRGVAWHLWHKEADRSELLKNDSILEETIRTKAVRTSPGADQYLSVS